MGTFKDYVLDDGSIVNVPMIMARLGLAKGSAKARIANGQRDPKKVFAAKGVRVGHAYSKHDKARRGRGHVKAQETKEQKLTRQQETLANFVIKHKPFYNDPFYRLALIAI